MYDEQIAQHYAAYRPPLHQLILAEILQDQQFEMGLDIGCGTGYSTLALTDYCDHVIGVDQSQSMLSRATKHAKAEYRAGTGELLPIDDGSINVVTLAGVYFYLDAEKTLNELARVCRKHAPVALYDFEILIEELMQLFGLAPEQDDTGYDHASNPSGMDGVSTIQQVTRTLSIQVTEAQAAHILLSDKARHLPLSDLYHTADPFQRVVEKLEQSRWSGHLQADIYYSLHQLQS